MFIPWRKVIQLSGEPVVEANRETTERRYRRRVEALEKAGFLMKDNRPAPARHTWEIVEVQHGGYKRTAGLRVRATARFVAAYQKAQRNRNFERIPASWLLTKPSD